MAPGSLIHSRELCQVKFNPSTIDAPDILDQDTYDLNLKYSKVYSGRR